MRAASRWSSPSTGTSGTSSAAAAGSAGCDRAFQGAFDLSRLALLGEDHGHLRLHHVGAPGLHRPGVDQVAERPFFLDLQLLAVVDEDDLRQPDLATELLRQS